MPIPILMPSLSPTMTEGNLVKWSKNIGDNIKPGDIIAEIETDKATMEVEAADEGIVKKILFKEGTQSIKVNTPIVIIDDGSLSNTTQDVEKKSDKKVINQKKENLSCVLAR